MDRINEVIAWGGEPHVQPVMKLNALVKRPWVRFDWTPQLLTDVARWADGWVRMAGFGRSATLRTMTGPGGEGQDEYGRRCDPNNHG